MLVRYSTLRAGSVLLPEIYSDTHFIFADLHPSTRAVNALSCWQPISQYEGTIISNVLTLSLAVSFYLLTTDKIRIVSS
jgi:hypothetical protein